MQIGFLEYVEEVLEKEEFERSVAEESSESSEFKEEIDDTFDRCDRRNSGDEWAPARLCNETATAISSSVTISVCTPASEYAGCLAGVG